MSKVADGGDPSGREPASCGAKLPVLVRPWTKWRAATTPNSHFDSNLETSLSSTLPPLSIFAFLNWELSGTLCAFGVFDWPWENVTVEG